MFYLRLTVITETIKQELSVPSSKAAERISGKAAEKEKWLEIEYASTKDMVADFFTKPLQGDAFLKFKILILGQKVLPMAR